MAAEFQHKMKNAPQHVAEFFEKNLKFAKSSSNAAKAAFVKAVCEEGFDAQFFKQFEKVQRSQSDGQEYSWESWKQVKDRHGDALAKKLLAQGKFETRPYHSGPMCP